MRIHPPPAASRTVAHGQRGSLRAGADHVGSPTPSLDGDVPILPSGVRGPPHYRAPTAYPWHASPGQRGAPLSPRPTVPGSPIAPSLWGTGPRKGQRLSGPGIASHARLEENGGKKDGSARRQKAEPGMRRTRQSGQSVLQDWTPLPCWLRAVRDWLRVQSLPSTWKLGALEIAPQAVAARQGLPSSYGLQLSSMCSKGAI